jgi:hypothetical protein
MAAGEAQLTDLPAPAVTGLAADQDGLGADQHELTPRAGTRPAGGTTAVLPLPGAGLVYQVTGGGPAVVLVHGFGLDMRMWERRIPGAEFRVVAGAGHMVNMEQPAAVNGLLTGFLAGLPGPATEGPAELAEQTGGLPEQTAGLPEQTGGLPEQTAGLAGRGDGRWSR